MRALFVLALIIGAASAGSIALPGVSASASASASFSASSSSSASSGGSFSSSVKVATPEVKIQKSISSEPCVGAVAPVKKAISSSISAKASSSASASASSSSSSKFSLSQRISRPCEPVRRIAPCVTPTVVQTPCVTPTVIKTPCVTPTIVKTPCVTPTVVKTVAPCVSATASARVAPCTVRQPCARVGCVSAPCVARKQTIFRRKIQPGCGPRAAPLCFRPTADMLRGKDLAVQMLTVRGMQWKCEPTQKEVVEPCETVIVPDPSPCLPFGRVIHRACDKVVAI